MAPPSPTPAIPQRPRPENGLGHPAGRVQAIGNLADALCRAGQLDEADQAVDSAVALATRIGHRLTLADVTWTRANGQSSIGSG